MTAKQPEAATFLPSGRVPNSIWPVLIYRGVEAGGASAMEAVFGRHDWCNAWRNGIYPFHHFHSTSHESLGIAAGSAEVRLGGEGGRDVVLSRGDVAILPAGTGHKRLKGTTDLIVVGAYPTGCRWDLIRADELDQSGYDAALARILAVPPPRTDPVNGPEGPLLRLWAN